MIGAAHARGKYQGVSRGKPNQATIDAKSAYLTIP